MRTTKFTVSGSPQLGKEFKVPSIMPGTQEVRSKHPILPASLEEMQLGHQVSRVTLSVCAQGAQEDLGQGEPGPG